MVVWVIDGIGDRERSVPRLWGSSLTRRYFHVIPPACVIVTNCTGPPSRCRFVDQASNRAVRVTSCEAGAVGQRHDVEGKGARVCHLVHAARSSSIGSEARFFRRLDTHAPSPSSTHRGRHYFSAGMTFREGKDCEPGHKPPPPVSACDVATGAGLRRIRRPLVPGQPD